MFDNSNAMLDGAVYRGHDGAWFSIGHQYKPRRAESTRDTRAAELRDPRAGRSMLRRWRSRLEEAKPVRPRALRGVGFGGYFTSRVWAMLVGWTRQTSLYVPLTCGVTLYVPLVRPQ